MYACKNINRKFRREFLKSRCRQFEKNLYILITYPLKEKMISLINTKNGHNCTIS